MADLFTYGDLVSELESFAGSRLSGAPGGTRLVINRAQRYIQDFYNGEWGHFFIRDYSVTVDGTGYYITLPTDFYKLHRLYKNTLERGLLMGESDFVIDVTSPANLDAAPTRRIRFWRARTALATMRMSYFRTVKDFTTTPTTQVPDMAGSGEAILEVAKWIIVKSERDSDSNEKKELYVDSVLAIRRLKNMDDDGFSEFSAPDPTNNSDAFEYDSYNLDDGGDSSRRHNPLYDVD